VPGREHKQISHENTFADDLETRAEIEDWLLQQATRAADRLAAAGQPGRKGSSKLRDPAFPPGPPVSYRDARESFDRRYFELLLRKHGGNVSRAAKECELSRESLYRHLRKHGFRPSIDP